MGLEDYDTEKPGEEDYDNRPEQKTYTASPTVVIHFNKSGVEYEMTQDCTRTQAEEVALRKAEVLKEQVEHVLEELPDKHNFNVTVAEEVTAGSVSIEQ